MKRFLPVMYSVYAAVCVYIILSLVWGEQGIIERRRLEQFRTTLGQNIDTLEELHGNLKKELQQLKTSSELIRLRSRELGYFGEEEMIIRISDYNRTRNFYSLGRILRHNYLQKDRKKLFRTVSFGVGIATFLFFTLFFGFTNDRKKK